MAQSFLVCKRQSKLVYKVGNHLRRSYVPSAYLPHSPFSLLPFVFALRATFKQFYDHKGSNSSSSRRRLKVPNILLNYSIYLLPRIGPIIRYSRVVYLTRACLWMDPYDPCKLTLTKASRIIEAAFNIY